MRVNPYSRALLDNVVDLLNRPPGGMADVADRWVAVGMPLENPAHSTDLALVTEYLDAWRRLVDGADERGRVAVLNGMLAEYTSPPTVTDHDGSGWHLHYRPERASLGEVLAAATTVAAAEHLTRHGMHRLGRCALAECGRVYVDHSRPGRQRYSSPACANRDAVRRHRRAAAGGPGRR